MLFNDLESIEKDLSFLFGHHPQSFSLFLLLFGEYSITLLLGGLDGSSLSPESLCFLIGSHDGLLSLFVLLFDLSLVFHEAFLVGLSGSLELPHSLLVFLGLECSFNVVSFVKFLLLDIDLLQDLELLTLLEEDPSKVFVLLSEFGQLDHPLSFILFVLSTLLVSDLLVPIVLLSIPLDSLSGLLLKLLKLCSGSPDLLLKTSSINLSLAVVIILLLLHPSLPLELIPFNLLQTRLFIGRKLGPLLPELLLLLLLELEEPLPLSLTHLGVQKPLSLGLFLLSFLALFLFKIQLVLLALEVLVPLNDHVSDL